MGSSAHLIMQISYISAANGITLRPEAEQSGFFSRLLGRSGNAVSFDKLSEAEQDLMLAIADLRAFEDTVPGSVIFHPAEIRLSHDAAAALTAGSASALGLPSDVHLTLQTDATGLLGHADFRLRCDWVYHGQRVSPSREGCILKTAQGHRRVPLWMKRALDLADGFQAEAPMEDHWLALAAFRQALEPGEDVPTSPSDGGRMAGLAMTSFLKGLTVRLADCFSVSPADNMTDFDVIPFSSASLDNRDIHEDDVSETDSEISGETLAAFQWKLHSLGARSAYQLGNNTYLVIDRAAAPALREIARASKAPRAERKAFIENPRAFIARAVTEELQSNPEFVNLDPAGQEEMIEAAAGPRLVETREYSDRVTGIERWRPEPRPMEGSGTTWLPEVFSMVLAEHLNQMETPELVALGDEMKARLNTTSPLVTIAGESVAVTDERVSAVDALISVRQQKNENLQIKDVKEKLSPFVLGTLDNTDDLTWTAGLQPRKSSQPDTLPIAIRTPLKQHQVNSFKWQVAAWRAGLPGVLNADEPGLGKTLQTIAFITWLKDHTRQPQAERRGPILIVAPTSLLVNWEEEVERHVVDGGFGRLERLYGASTTANKRRGARGRDTDNGLPQLDLDWLHEALEEGRAHHFWVLTTYTTLANYQHSLGSIPFSAMVCDEMQAVKNENTLRAKAVKAMNADFRIGLTGTPIENTALDLWTIMDLLAPGSLGSGADFRQRYSEPTEVNMAELHGRVFRDFEGKPALAMRRLKDDVARDLPTKTRHIHPRLMPTAQASEYDLARRKLAEGGMGAALKMLHHIRSVSVHPGGEAQSADQDFIHASGRMSATFDILDRLHLTGERALLFIEHRELQYRVAEILRQRYRLAKVEIINGETPILRRQKIVNSFQEHLVLNDGFDVLVLGPRAAGTGLTLTAATHVIHLSRWWNPAVEEQCNDRIHRIGQSKPVTIHLPMAIHPSYAESSFDCLLQSLMQRKRRLARQALWPLGDTAADSQSLQDMLRSQAKAECSDPLEQALSAMFSRDGMPLPVRQPDGSRVVA